MKNFVELGERGYPKLLAQIKRPPKRLYFKGSWDDELFEKCLAVVGSRKMTIYGEKVTNLLVFGVAEAGITIVSGFMYGIDAVAHSSALEVGGKTIAVMPCGIDLVIPSYQQDLYEKIIYHGGLIVSEYEGSFPPDSWTFSDRNRIVAGLSQGTLVVEAGKNSGSLITANFAKKFERKVFAVPGNINSKTSEGALLLIEEGADMVTSFGKILKFYGLFENSKKNQIRRDKEHNQVLSLLELEPLTVDTLSKETGESVSELTSQLTFLEMQGIISYFEGKYYVS